jgi:Putative MetA-pathway of phenol degradation
VRRFTLSIFAAFCVAFALAPFLPAQDNYEIQVYPSETVAPGQLMLELHSNFAFEGEKQVVDGVRPSEHALHETIELTFGINSWFETGFYVFTSARSGEGWQWVGDHVRPRVRAPESWHWPVGVSLSTEFGYQRRAYSPDTWTWEIRPIVDKQLGRWYLSFNPAVDKAVHGMNASRGFEFSPNFKASYDVTRVATVGIEYYGALGPVTRFDSGPQQQHQIVPALDLNVSPDWELNVGAAVGLTRTTDRFIFKMIIGRRFGL